MAGHFVSIFHGGTLGCLEVPPERLSGRPEWTATNGLHEKKDEGVRAAEKGMESPCQLGGSGVHSWERSEGCPEDGPLSSLLRRLRGQPTLGGPHRPPDHVCHHTPTGRSGISAVCAARSINIARAKASDQVEGTDLGLPIRSSWRVSGGNVFIAKQRQMQLAGQRSEQSPPKSGSIWLWTT